MYQCPKCNQTIDLEGLPCHRANCLPKKHGVLRLLTDDFQTKLFEFEERFVSVREQSGVRIKDTSLYPKLPFIQGHPKYDFPEWAGFRNDLVIIKKTLKDRQGLRILNFGSWNGWLSNRLVEMGQNVTAISYFIDEYDGLGACQHYSNRWTSVQMDIEHGLQVLMETYDVIIINRGLSYLSNPYQTLTNLKQKLNPRGKLIITGIHIWNNSTLGKKRFEQKCQAYHDKYHQDLMLRPTKGYLDQQDQRSLKKLKVQLKPYPGLTIQNNLKKILRRSISRYYGLYTKPAVS